MNNELYQLLLSLRIGDGCYITQCKYKTPPTYTMQTSGIKEDYIQWKRNLIEYNGITTHTTSVRSGFNKNCILYSFRTHIHPDVSLVGNMSKIDVIKSLNKFGLILYFLDDGARHKAHNTVHLYCNSFTEEEVNALVEKIYELYPIKKCAIRKDRKKDGREFPYLYMPTTTSAEFLKDARQFLLNNNIQSLLYKTISPSQTIENIE